jgi:hypothetical protein
MAPDDVGEFLALAGQQAGFHGNGINRGRGGLSGYIHGSQISGFAGG